jgi:phosphatidylglycerol:prolipoprotein diacylglycerol transferase
MVFPFVDQQARHPSMLYEALLEGLVLFIILWVYSSKSRPLRAVSGMFMLFYGLFRFGVEFVRQPDAHLGFIAFDWLTMGHVLSAPMVLYGIYLLVFAYKPAEKHS